MNNNLLFNYSKNEKRSNEYLDTESCKKLKINSLSPVKDEVICHEESDDFIHIDNDNSFMLKNQFRELGLKEELLKGIQDFGLFRPTSIQENLFPTCNLEINPTNQCILLQGQPGAGKTISSIILLLQKIDTNICQCQALVATAKEESIPHVSFKHFCQVQ